LAAGAEAGFAEAAAATEAVRAGAATATSSVFFVTFFAGAVLVAEAAFIIPWAEEETEDILRRTYCYAERENHFLPEIFVPGIQ
jgi:hypothetical protein